MAGKHIGFIGPGKIGEPMVERLSAAGYRITVFARRTEVADRLRAGGATVARTLEGVAGAPIVISCVFDDDALCTVAPPVIEQMAPGSIFVSHTTGSPLTVGSLASIAASRGVETVEAPFSGTPALIREGQLTVALAGERSAVDRVADVVKAYASQVHRTGTLGTALSAKLLNNALFAAFTQITLSALESARRLGIAERALLDLLADSSGGSTAARYIASSGTDAAAYQTRIARYLTKDIDAARIAADELDVDISELLAAARLGPIDLTPPTTDDFTAPTITQRTATIANETNVLAHHEKAIPASAHNAER